MLPTGHTAAGFLTAYGLVKILKPELEPSQINGLFLAGAFWGFAPDLDVFYFFIKNKTLLVAGKESGNDSHRRFTTHTPVWWLLAGLVVYFFSTSGFWKHFGLLIWLGSWSHFLLDSIEYGIAWLGPFSQKLYAFKDAEYSITVNDRNFLKHSIGFLLLYIKRPTFYIEVLIILIAFYLII